MQNVFLKSFRFFQIASCAVHHSGALLLEARDGFMLDQFLRPVTGGIAATQLPTAFPPAAAAALPITSVEEAQQPKDDGFGDGDAMDDHFGGDGSDFPMDDAAPLPNESPNAEATAAAQMGEEQQELAFDNNDDDEEEEFDPYEPLDPSDAGTMPSKPFKRYSRLPTKPKMRAAQQQTPSTALTDGLLLLPAPATGLLFPEFHYALHQSQVEDAREARKSSREVAAARRSKKSATAATAVFTLHEAEEAAAAVAAEDEDKLFDDDNKFDPEFFDDQIDAGMPDDDEFEGAFANAGGGDGWDGGGPLGDLVNENGGNDADISYEDLCRAHVESLISAAAAAEVQTELASRVSTWRMKMAPVLEEEDARPEFDIHYYGERILQGLAKLSVAETTGDIQQNEENEEDTQNPVPKTKNKKSSRDAKNKNTDSAPALTGPAEFSQVVHGAEIENNYDVPRLFSSMLQLVNNANLRVSKINDSSDNFKISLLSTELKHKRIEAYLAPSSAAAEAEMEGESMHQVEEAAEELRVLVTAVKKPTSKRRKA